MDDQRAQPEVPTRLFKDDTRFALGRIAVFQYTAVAAFFVLITGCCILQVRDESFNSELAERNRIKTVPLLAPRGKILDRDGRVIVDNHSSFEFWLSRETLKPEHIPAIATELNMTPDEIRAPLARAESKRSPKYFPVLIKPEL